MECSRNVILKRRYVVRLKDQKEKFRPLPFPYSNLNKSFSDFESARAAAESIHERNSSLDLVVLVCFFTDWEIEYECG